MKKLVLIAFSILLLVPASQNAFAAVTPGEILYGVTGGDDFYEFWQLTDPLTEFFGEDAETLSGIEFDTDGTLYAAGAGNGGDTFGTINLGDGSFNFISTGVDCTDIGIDPIGELLYCQLKDELYTIDKGTGALSGLIGLTGLGSSGGGHAIDFAPDGTLYYGNGNGFWTLDKGTGAVATSIGAWTIPVEISSTNCRPNAFDFDSSGTLWASLKCGSGTGDVHLVTIDEITGAMTFVENTVSELDGISFDGGPGPGLAVGSISIPLDSTSMLVAGTQMNSIWITLAIAATVGVGVIIIRKIFV